MADVSSGAGHAVQGCDGGQLGAVESPVMAAPDQAASAAPGKMCRSRVEDFAGPSTGRASGAEGGDGGR